MIGSLHLLVLLLGTSLPGNLGSLLGSCPASRTARRTVRLVFFRHGQSVANAMPESEKARNVISASLSRASVSTKEHKLRRQHYETWDSPLSNRGRWQADTMFGKLKTFLQITSGDSVVSTLAVSPLVRTHQTAAGAVEGPAGCADGCAQSLAPQNVVVLSSLTERGPLWINKFRPHREVREGKKIVSSRITPPGFGSIRIGETWDSTRLARRGDVEWTFFPEDMFSRENTPGVLREAGAISAQDHVEKLDRFQQRIRNPSLAECRSFGGAKEWAQGGRTVGDVGDLNVGDLKGARLGFNELSNQALSHRLQKDLESLVEEAILESKDKIPILLLSSHSGVNKSYMESLLDPKAGPLAKTMGGTALRELQKQKIANPEAFDSAEFATLGGAAGDGRTNTKAYWEDEAWEKDAPDTVGQLGERYMPNASMLSLEVEVEV